MDDLTYTTSMIQEIKELLSGARQRVAVQVNTELLSTYWNVGRIIVEYEQNNQKRAAYGKQTLKALSKELTKEFGKGFSVSNLQFMRRFYQTYQIQQTVSVKLSWSHYCELLTISDDDRRSFYEKEAINSGWSIREMKRQIATSLYERLLLSDGKANQEKVLALAEKGIEMAQPAICFLYTEQRAAYRPGRSRIAGMAQRRKIRKERTRQPICWPLRPFFLWRQIVISESYFGSTCP